MGEQHIPTVLEVITELGGFATAAQLREQSSRERLRTAVRAGRVVAIGRGRYALPTADEASAAAARLGGVISHLSAAAYHGWEVLEPPERPMVCVPRSRKLTPEARRGTSCRWRSLTGTQLDSGVTGVLTTVLDCARDLDLPAGLAVVDQALRSGDVSRDELVSAAAKLQGPGSAKVRRAVALGDRRAANAFESGLRALAIEAELDVLPQQPVPVGDITVHPDLLDAGRALILEADSWTYHAEKSAFRRDIERYDSFVVLGYRVLRFTREHVVHRSDWVRATLATARRAPPVRPGRRTSR